MADDLEKVGVVILAAGKGKRMQAKLPLPKVLYPLCGRPMMSYLLESLGKSELKAKPVIVIAPDLEIIPQTFGSSYEYATQERQLGTGHAVLSAKEKLLDFEHILVLYGDHPLVSASCINQLINKHLETTSILTLATVKLKDFEDWRAGFLNFGRVVRDKNGKILRIVEKKDADDEELKITEVNPSYFCFKADWLWETLPKLGCNNAQAEYYLTDLVELALKQKKEIASLVLFDSSEALGVNTLEQFALVEKIMNLRLK